jgi:hypothetical protein
MTRGGRGRAVAGVAAAIAAFALAIAVIDRLAPAPRGPESSAYATSPPGLAAYAELLERSGHRVIKRRTKLAGEAAPQGTLVVLDAAGIDQDEADAISRFVLGGGRLVAGGVRGASWLGDDLPVRGDHPPDPAGVLAPASETQGVTTVRPLDGGALDRLGGALPIVGSPGAVLAAVARPGRGRVIVLADASPLQNRALAEADNAAFGLALAGAPGEPVTFLETVHGYGAETGLAAIPARARWALLLLALAGIAFCWSHARRIGPPEEDERPLPPPRGDYVDALAGALVRTQRPAEVARPVRAAARDALARRAGLPADAPEAALADAAQRVGLGDAETAALLREPDDLDGALATGRALAAIEGGGRR